MTAITDETFEKDTLRQLRENMVESLEEGHAPVATVNVSKDDEGWFGSIEGEYFNILPGESPSAVLRRIADALEGVQ